MASGPEIGAPLLTVAAEKHKLFDDLDEKEQAQALPELPSMSEAPLTQEETLEGKGKEKEKHQLQQMRRRKRKEQERSLLSQCR
ncbi:hypothetical protein C0995_004342 [Termitomyces sp. Mi166|nr:hypothetical protein C0995_004342 [Termitomyces sp. Mi166\